MGTVFELSPVPEPSAFVLTALGVFGFVMSRLKRACFARRFNLCVVLVLVAALQQAQTVAHAATVRTVALSGQPAPGTPSGVNFVSFISTSRAERRRPNRVYCRHHRQQQHGPLVGGCRQSALVARRGSQAPGTPSGVNFGSFQTPVLNDAGHTAFHTQLTIASGIWSERSGSLAMVVGPGTQPPGAPSGVFLANSGDPVLNNDGQTAFYARLTGSGIDSTNDQSIWSEGSGSLTLVARAGSHASGTPGGVNFGGFNNSPVLNNAGQTAFYGFLVGAGVDNTNNQGIWSEGSGSLALVARTEAKPRACPAA